MSFIYWNIWIYRFVMNVLYAGKYKKRFKDITALLGPHDRSVVELCFGDWYIAMHCRKSGKTWKGFDMNKSFVARAIGKGFSAEAVDLLATGSLPRADVCIMAGSLYHFHEAIDRVLPLMLACAPKIIISEPVKNVSARSGFTGAIAGYLSNAGNGGERFRYTRESLTAMLDVYKEKYAFTYEKLSEGKDLLLKIAYERNQRRHTDL
jgi:hypothetical protein